MDRVEPSSHENDEPSHLCDIGRTAVWQEGDSSSKHYTEVVEGPNAQDAAIKCFTAIEPTASRSRMSSSQIRKALRVKKRQTPNLQADAAP